MCSDSSVQTIINMARDRGAFIDQSQSLNLHLAGRFGGRVVRGRFNVWGLVRSARYFQVVLHALLRVEGWTEDRVVLLEDQVQGAGYPVYG